jgi:hypothetical protein
MLPIVYHRENIVPYKNKTILELGGYCPKGEIN